MSNPPDIAALVLAWYETHHRDLPWRVTPRQRAQGILPDPYRVWLSEIMLQQTTVASVKAYFERFTARWPSVSALAAADEDAVRAVWAGLGYYRRAINLHRAARIVADQWGGRFPATVAELKTLPGIGDYTAAAIAAIAFNQPAAVMDGNIERIMARLMAHEQPLPKARKVLLGFVESLTPTLFPGDFAQGLMDLGATVCTPRAPECDHCPLALCCKAHARGIAATLPRKIRRAPKPERLGTAIVVYRADGAVLLRKRRDAGLLAGMAEVPGSEWGAETAEPVLPMKGRRSSVGTVRHVFTHFSLSLAIIRLDVPQSEPAPPGHWWSAVDQRAHEALPTVMRKAIDLAERARS